MRTKYEKKNKIMDPMMKVKIKKKIDKKKPRI